MIFPFAPHLGAEVYELMTVSGVGQPWPEATAAILTSDTVEVVVQRQRQLATASDAGGRHARGSEGAGARVANVV